MNEILIARHSLANYPFDELTKEGIDFAVQNKTKFLDYKIVVCSPLNRSLQTALALGHLNPLVDERLREFEADVKALSADEYIQIVHMKFASELYSYGDRLLDAIREYGKDTCLFVAHNAVMSAAFFLLTGEITPFKNLEGFKVEVGSDGVGNPEKVGIY